LVSCKTWTFRTALSGLCILTCQQHSFARSASLSHCFARTSSQLNQLPLARQIMRRAFCAAYGASKRPSPSPSIGRLCITAFQKVVPSPVKGRRHIEHKAPRLLADTRSRVASWLTAAGQMQFVSQGLLWFPIRLGFRNRRSTVRDIAHSNLHVGFDTKSSIPNSPA
jgi:hypothetical protein